MIKISKYLDPKLIAFLNVKTRDEAIQEMIEKLAASGRIADTLTFHQALMKREEIVSTGIGMGTAIPHAKLPEYDDFFMIVGVLQHGVDWDSLDGSLVRLVFMIGGPDDKQTEYLQLLSSLTMAIKNEERRKKILSLNSPEAIVDLFRDF